MTDSIDTSQEFTNPTTEQSQKSPPIPSIPPTPNSPSPFASPSSPLNLQPLTKNTDCKQILKPVAPSKRPVTGRTTLNDSYKFNIGNAFLPKELAEIVAIQQRRERAWHARLMICTTTISSLESTFTNFKDEIEVEEVVAFKAYLQLAIPTLRQWITHLPPAPLKFHHTLDRSTTWATVARKGKKKARISLSTKTIVAPVRKATQSLTTKNNSPTRDSPSIATTDRRLFARLPQEHEWRKLSPAGIREVIVRKLAISSALFGKIKPVHSGFALSLCSTEARETILDAGNGLFLSGAKLESTTNRTPVIVPTVPATIRKEHGEEEVSKSMLTSKIERVCAVRPIHVKLYGGNKSGAPHRTWMAYFTTAPRTGFQVFDESEIARKFKKQQPLEFCKKCNGYQPTKNRSRAPSCGNCGSTNHVDELCMAATKCRNCGDPHRSDSRRCLVRPTRSGVPTKEQMKTYRQAGEREYQAVDRAKTAEDLAASTQIGGLDITSSEEPEAENTTNNSQAPLVEKPWWSSRTKTQPYFDLYLPFGGIDIRPRAATYVKKDPKRLNSVQKYPSSPTGDSCWVEVNKILFLNVYKAPHYPSAVQPLLNWTPTSKAIAIGEPTHRAGNTLDLAWTNFKEAMVWIATEECMASDHLPICGFVPNCREAAANLCIRDKIRVSKANLPKFTQAVSRWIPPLTPLNTIEETEDFAQNIC
ncbi:hypothetical protein EPUL_003544 [Erysiphe pulchra]|uniref:Uncharacterized protein n=1 Tax=Erysiphe pulchra TaxID=225359 RepID=A0A2S4PR45_9PEZI|nr:hypothetical protein EPUL_003544 [Erysiphe pulchra]